MKFFRLLLLVALPLAASAVPSDPVGVLRLKLRGASDTRVSAPLHRPAIAEAAVLARLGNVLTLDTQVSNIPPGGAYAQVMSGALEGAVLPITDSVNELLTVDASAYDLSLLAVGSSEGDLVNVVPYWTLDSLFPDGKGIHVSTSKLVAKSSILLYDPSTAGINRSASAVYFFFAGNSSYSRGWYRFGDLSRVRGDTRIPPYYSFIVRHALATTDSEMLLCGNVQMSAFRVPVGTQMSNIAQDNIISSPLPVAATLSDLRLFESGAFSASPSKLVATDQLFVFDNTAVGQNKSASAVYFYFAGNGSYSAGWYRFGDLTQSAAHLVLKPGEAFILRKSASSTVQTSTWAALPDFLQ